MSFRPSKRRTGASKPTSPRFAPSSIADLAGRTRKRGPSEPHNARPYRDPASVPVHDVGHVSSRAKLLEAAMCVGLSSAVLDRESLH